MSFARSIAVTALYELHDSFRSRRTLALFVVYLVVATASAYGIITFIHKLEIALAEDLLQLGASAEPLVLLDALAENPVYKNFINRSFADSVVATNLLALPPIAVIYGWLTYLTAPILVMLSTSSRVSEEVSTGSVRYVLYRSTRLGWCLGKFVGQALQILVALLVGSLGAWAIASLMLTSMDGPGTLVVMLEFAFKNWIYSLAFIGLAFWVSQWIRSPNTAAAVGVVALVATVVLSGFAYHYLKEDPGSVWVVVKWVLPVSHGRDLIWSPGTDRVVPGGLFLCALSMVYLLMGYARFCRRDL